MVLGCEAAEALGNQSSPWEVYAKEVLEEATAEGTREDEPRASPDKLAVQRDVDGTEVDARTSPSALSVPVPAPQRLPRLPAPLGGGFEFRTGKTTPFPEIAQQDGETHEQAAFRVAGERRAAGVKSFSDGSVWGAQVAVDAWGQGILALERLRNLRRYSAKAADGAERSTLVRPTVPSAEEENAMALALRLNLAQGLLKLREFEACTMHCEVALELDPTNAKALWRKAKAVWGVRNPGLARETLARLLAVEPGNPAAQAMLREIDAEEARRRLRRGGSRPAEGTSASRSDEPCSAAVPGNTSRALRQRPPSARHPDMVPKADTGFGVLTPAAESDTREGLRNSFCGCCRRRQSAV